MKSRFFAALAVTALSMGCTLAGAAVVRCTAPDGHVTYQDSTCAKGSRGDPVDDTPNRGFRFADPKDVERLRKERAASRLREAAPIAAYRNGNPKRRTARVAINAGERRFITAGMQATDVRAKIGAPDQVVRPSSSPSKPTARNASQRWVYLPADDDPQTTTVLSVRGGIVTHVDRRVTR